MTRLDKDGGKWSKIIAGKSRIFMHSSQAFERRLVVRSDDQILRLNLDKINFDSDVQDDSIIDGKLEVKTDMQRTGVTSVDRYLMVHEVDESKMKMMVKMIDIESMKIVSESTYDLTSIKDAEGDIYRFYFEFKIGDWTTKIIRLFYVSNHFIAVTVIRGKPVIGYGQASGNDRVFYDLYNNCYKASMVRGKVRLMAASRLTN